MSDGREQKNAIFGGGAQGQGAVEAVDRVKAELGLDIPVEQVPLPSKGQVYPSTSPLHNCETVDVRAMTTREEDILTSKALIKKGTVITELIRSCLMSKDIDVREMIAGDRNALMVAVRIMGYGPDYKADIECSACQKINKDYEFVLDKLELKRLEISPVQPGMNLFEFTLPVSKKVVQFKFLTGKDEEEIVVTQERMKKLGTENDRLVSGRLKYAVQSVEGKTDKSLINAFLDKLLARDSLELRRYIEKNEPGINMNQEFACTHCDHIEEVAIPIGTNFFWPQS
jgi:hypothetical protein